MRRILVTGSNGMIGRALVRALSMQSVRVVRFDLDHQRDDRGDIRDRRDVERAIVGCDGVIHLAAVSRIEPAEADPDTCVATNVSGTQAIVQAALAVPSPPWVVFASSREVYGDVEALPATEATPRRPRNVYGQSKLEAERAIEAAAAAGLPTAIVRLSNVYGSIHDHPSRVIPAFTRAAHMGLPLIIRGADSTLDFVHRDDVVRGLLAVAERLSMTRASLPPVQLVSGFATTLGDLATLTVRLARSNSRIHIEPPQSVNVRAFVGSNVLACRELGWTCQTQLEVGVMQMLEDFRQHARATHPQRKEHGCAS